MEGAGDCGDQECDCRATALQRCTVDEEQGDCTKPAVLRENRQAGGPNTRR